jgi:hypothetical protein
MLSSRQVGSGDLEPGAGMPGNRLQPGVPFGSPDDSRLVGDRKRPTRIGTRHSLKTAGIAAPQADSAIHEAAE